jgi:uncharacterized membrane protein
MADRGGPIMTVGYGFGMLAMGLLAILIAGLIIFKIINHKPKEDTYGK